MMMKISVIILERRITWEFSSLASGVFTFELRIDALFHHGEEDLATVIMSSLHSAIACIP